MEEQILKAIGMEAVYYTEIFGIVIEDISEEEDFIESIQSLKDKGHVNYYDYTTGQETNLFQLIDIHQEQVLIHT